MRVTRENYKHFDYISDYRTEEFKNASIEQLRAQKFYITDIYRGTRGPLNQVKRLALQTIRQAIQEKL